MHSAHLVLRLAGPGGVEREHHRKLKGGARVADDVELVLRCLRRRGALSMRVYSNLMRLIPEPQTICPLALA